MNTAGERSKSLWMEVAAPHAPRLTERLTADVVIVGSGIAGVSTAYELAEAGLSVIVLDRGPLGRGITSRTTAHLSYGNDDGFDEVISKHGEEGARNNYESQKAAIDRLDEIQQNEGIDCDFVRVDGLLFAPSSEDDRYLEKEREASRKIGFNIDWTHNISISGPYSKVLRYPEQAHFHPLKYLYGVITVLKKKGVRFFANSPVRSFEEGTAAVTLKTDTASVSAKHAVLATNSPIANRLVIHDKQGPYRSYAFAAEIKRGSLPDALYWDTEDPYHYVRLQPGRNGKDYIVVGGEDHKTGEANDADERFKRLETWAKTYFPMTGKVTHRWSGQVLEPFDYLPFIGKNPGQEKIFIATGDSGQGFSNGPLAGLILGGLIADGRHKWAEMHEPSRKTLAAIVNLAAENVTPMKNFAGYVTPGEISNLRELKRGEGAIMRDGLSKIAVFRDASGTVHKRSAVCTHAGCLVSWNSYEKCWDCSCHGSHFSTGGEVLNGPAMTPLTVVKSERKPVKRAASQRKNRVKSAKRGAAR